MKFTTNEILEVLDDAVEVGAFPMPHNAYYYYADMRMTIFRGEDEWLWVFEVLRYSCSQRVFCHEIVAMGNRLKGKLFNDFQSLCTFEPLPGHKLTDEEGEWILDPYDFQMIIKGEIHSFHLSSDDYLNAGIDVNSEMPLPARVIRFLSYRFGKLLYANEAELLNVCGRLNSNLRPLIQLDEWRHTNLLLDEIPSYSDTFQSLAEAIIENDPSRYLPKEESNIHWSNWTELED